MAGIWQTLASLAAAGTLLLHGAVDTAAPHNADTSLLLVNRDWRISEDYYPLTRVAQVPGQLRQLQPEASLALEALFAACREEAGVQLTSVSGYRSYDKQERVYNNKLKSVKGDVEKADDYVARPGASEHQTGLSIDIGQKNSKTANLGASFARTKGGEWVRENAWRFGFILRYDEGWEEITGYEYEPWHIRYVGLEHAAAIRMLNRPLEEYIAAYRYQVLMRLVTQE